MPSTSVYALPYLAPTDPPDIAGATQGLGEATEDELARVDAARAALTPAGATVATSQTTGSTSFTDLATAGPAVTLVTGSTVLVHLSAQIFNSGANYTNMAFAVSGATTQAAVDTKSLTVFGTNAVQAGVTILVTGLTPGSNTFTCKYKVTAGTGTFIYRNIVVAPF